MAKLASEKVLSAIGSEIDFMSKGEDIVNRIKKKDQGFIKDFVDFSKEVIKERQFSFKQKFYCLYVSNPLQVAQGIHGN